MGMPSYRMKHGQRLPSGVGATDWDSKLQEAKIKLRCREAENGILAVQSASLALSAVKKAQDLDYRGQAGTTCSQRNLQKVELMKAFEITMYNRARDALITLGHMAKDAFPAADPAGHVTEGDPSTSFQGGLETLRWDGVVLAEWGDDIKWGSGFATEEQGV
ncbi:hypothetical protein DFH07DRAFT_775582 [Mycena maculata]|uniref:Uncharacterized protein n=1 Tax=Mycena maculata TaxID=230809 RepID=A0AAD7N7M1_9AGAR|nr:hypothetical protein DFH07DRAFT_775582 [Mycena maculata]